MLENKIHQNRQEMYSKEFLDVYSLYHSNRNTALTFLKHEIIERNTAILF